MCSVTVTLHIRKNTQKIKVSPLTGLQMEKNFLITNAKEEIKYKNISDLIPFPGHRRKKSLKFVQCKLESKVI